MNILVNIIKFVFKLFVLMGPFLLTIIIAFVTLLAKLRLVFPTSKRLKSELGYKVWVVPQYSSDFWNKVINGKPSKYTPRDTFLACLRGAVTIPKYLVQSLFEWK